jgi:hypothetical protein
MVGRVEVKPGNGIGSGFMMDGGSLGKHYADLPLFFTARQVIPGRWRSLPSQLTVTFDAMTDDPQGGTANVERLLAASAQQDLNYSVVLLDRWPGSVLTVNLAPRDPEPGDPIFVLGYPRGRGLALSLDDNDVISFVASKTRVALLNDADVLMYRAPTEPGSSGSAVFNENWELVAIHMAADKQLQSNYGARMQSVLADVAHKLKDVVLEEEVIARIKAPRALSLTPNYFSVFISYSHLDSIFADRLFNTLRSKGVKVWYDKQDILPGYDLYDEITKGIREQDKILFCCSEAAIKSGWVDAEVDRALQKERELFRAAAGGQLVQQSRGKPLIPLDLDGYLLAGHWESGKAPDLLSRGIADFRNWQNQAEFERVLERLLSALRPDLGR